MTPLEDLGDAFALAWGAGAALILGGLVTFAVLGSCVRGARRLANCLRRRPDIG